VVPSGLTQVHVIRLALPSTAYSPTLFSHPGPAEIQFVSQALSNTKAQVKPYCHHYTRRSETRLLADSVTPRVSEEQRCDVLAIFDSEDRYGWVARDSLTRQAVCISVTLPYRQQDPIARFRTIREMSVGAKAPNYPISVGFERSADLLLQREGPWVEEYHLCPLLEVMADGSDRAAPWPLEAGRTMPRITRSG
jgi:hypothetical protein